MVREEHFATVMKDSEQILKTVSIVKAHSLSISEQPLTAEETAEIQHEEEDKQRVSSARKHCLSARKNKMLYDLHCGKDNAPKCTLQPWLRWKISFINVCVDWKIKTKKHEMFDPKYWNRSFRSIIHSLTSWVYRHTKVQRNLDTGVYKSTN